MKRKYALALLLAFAVSSVTACGSAEENADAILTLLGVDSEETEEETEAPETTAAVSEAETERAAEGEPKAASGDSSAVPFDETEIYDTIVDILDTNFADNPHSLEFNRYTQKLNLYIQAPDSLREALDGRDPGIMAAWGEVRDNMGNLGAQLWELVQITGGVEAVDLFMVEELKEDSSEYGVEDVLLAFENGELVYDYGE